MMKSLIINSKGLLVTIFLAVFIFSTCTDQLNAPPIGVVGDAQLANANGINSAIIGIYSNLFSSRQTMWWIYGDIAGALTHKGSNSGDQPAMNPFEKMEHTPSNPYLNSNWQRRFEGVSRVNAALTLINQALENGAITEGEATDYIAEVRMLRGLLYFHLTRTFGKVPWIDPDTEDFKQPNDALRWPEIEADWQFAADNLPEQQSDLGRPNSWAALAFLGKAYLYQGKYAEANAVFEDVINNGVNGNGVAFGLNPNYHDNFNGDTEHGAEWIWDMEFTVDPNAENLGDPGLRNCPYAPHPLQCWGFFQPTQNFVNSFRVDASGHPLLSGYPSDDTWNSDPVADDQLVSSSDVSWTQDGGPVDPRLDWSVIRRGIPFHDWGPFAGQVYIREQSWSGPYHAKKFLYWRGQATAYQQANTEVTQVNLARMRFADLLLMHAETEVELVASGGGGNLADAMADVNAIRVRARDGSYVENSFNEAFAAAVVDNEAAMLASGANLWQWVVRTDTGTTWMFVGDNGDEDGQDGPADPDNWIEYSIPTYDVEPYTLADFSSVTEARKRVHFERKLELGLEGHWFFDLVRWGEADDYLAAAHQYEGNEWVTGGGTVGLPASQDAVSFTPNKNEVFPIPQRQIDITTVNGVPTLQQNPNY